MSLVLHIGELFPSTVHADPPLTSVLDLVCSTHIQPMAVDCVGHT